MNGADVNYGRIANFTLVRAQLTAVGLDFKMKQLMTTYKGTGGERLFASLEVANVVFGRHLSLWI